MNQTGFPRNLYPVILSKNGSAPFSYVIVFVNTWTSTPGQNCGDVFTADRGGRGDEAGDSRQTFRDVTVPVIRSTSHTTLGTMSGGKTSAHRPFHPRTCNLNTLSGGLCKNRTLAPSPECIPNLRGNRADCFRPPPAACATTAGSEARGASQPALWTPSQWAGWERWDQCLFGTISLGQDEPCLT